MVMGGTSEIESIQTSMLRALASTHRLRIIHILGAGSVEVRDIARELGVSQATASQHLAAMRAVGLVEAIREGRLVRYRLTDPEILAACDLMRDVLVRRLSLLGDLAASAQAADAVQSSSRVGSIR